MQIYTLQLKITKFLEMMIFGDDIKLGPYSKFLIIPATSIYEITAKQVYPKVKQVCRRVNQILYHYPKILGN